MSKSVSWSELSKHSTAQDCWVALHGKVYDVTQFLAEHPGGAKVIAKWAGGDGTKSFDAIHPKTMMQQLSPETFIGDLDETTRPKEAAGAAVAEEMVLPPIQTCLNSYDFEAVARKRMQKENLDYLTSAADDEVTFRENSNVFSRVWLRPSILVNIKEVDTTCNMLGAASSFPAYVSSVALGKLYHPDGECGLAIGAEKIGIPFAIPCMGSNTFDEIKSVATGNPTRWLQLYVNPDREKALDMIRRAEAIGTEALLITVDAPVFGKRERDRRNKVEVAPVNQKSGAKASSSGVVMALQSFVDCTLTWDDMKWFRSVTKMKIVLKGVQRWEDAVMAAEAGLDGIVLSNHGGRQLDFARSGLELLAEVMPELRKRNLNIEVLMDGGVRRGTDIFKAIALGANGVGLGRSAIWALGSYGTEGVEAYLQILKDEFELCMKLCGVKSVADIGPQYISCDFLQAHVTAAPARTLAVGQYVPLKSAL
mmetsp:Transcript_13770/g.34631  ORF Transcript_13770/g.34631 Transcript_13770/m.34631 type:complete len:480 (+) Transcript_13770:121-1560(+)